MIIAVVGNKKSGKTTVIEVLVREFTKRGYKVATVKHIPEAEFTIDAKGKDTWRHAKAGACTVVSVAPNEVAIIRKVDTTTLSLDEIAKNFGDDVDIIILEGFRKLIEKDASVPKIVAAKTTEEALTASSKYQPILTFVGPVSTEATKLEIPYIDPLKEPKRLVNIVEKELAASVEKRRKSKEEIRIEIDGRSLSLNPFVQKFMRKTILAMISSLRDASIKGDEKVFVIIKRGH